jgi:hypothetical protein
MRDRRGRHLVRRFVLLASRVAGSVGVARRDRVTRRDRVAGSVGVARRDRVGRSDRVAVGWVGEHRLVVPPRAPRQPLREQS